jgi:hypothetical protein
MAFFFTMPMSMIRLLRFRVKLLGVRPIERVIVAALGHAPAHADGLRNRQVCTQPRDARDLGAQPVHDVGNRGHTLPARFQVNHQPAGVGGGEKAAAGGGEEAFHVGILDDNLGQALLVQANEAL